jgi:hypothetical protein
MDAQVGDRLVVEGHHVGTGRRAGSVIEVLGAPAARHYRVQWDDGHETVFFPSSDTRVVRSEGAEAPGSIRQAVTHVELRFEEDEDHTDAWATLRTPTEAFTGSGRARRNPVDENIPLLGEELAAARALIALGDKLRASAGDAIEHGRHPEGHLVGAI